MYPGTRKDGAHRATITWNLDFPFASSVAEAKKARELHANGNVDVVVPQAFGDVFECGLKAIDCLFIGLSPGFSLRPQETDDYGPRDVHRYYRRLARLHWIRLIANRSSGNHEDKKHGATCAQGLVHRFRLGPSSPPNGRPLTCRARIRYHTFL